MIDVVLTTSDVTGGGGGIGGVKINGGGNTSVVAVLHLVRVLTKGNSVLVATGVLVICAVDTLAAALPLV